MVGQEDRAAKEICRGVSRAPRAARGVVKVPSVREVAEEAKGLRATVAGAAGASQGTDSPGVEAVAEGFPEVEEAAAADSREAAVVAAEAAAAVAAGGAEGVITMKKEKNVSKGNAMNLPYYRGKDNGPPHAVCIFVASILLTGALLASSLSAQDSGKIFLSPEDAMKGLIAAAENNDTKAILAVLGPEAKDILSSGDTVSDKADVERFVANCREKMDLVRRGDRVSVIIGNDNTPFAIPIVKKGGGWVFDTRSGKEEVLNRRVGRNELDTIDTCEAYVEAQEEYASADRELDGIMQYAQKFFSDSGKRNGLYWDVAEGEDPSPMGPLVAEAAAEGYAKKERPIPYHGYYFKILKGQGKNAPGGAYSYVINNHMVAGFALVAWPAEYGNSGIMTFVVNQNGIVYEKNLGSKTEKVAKTMTLYNPDRTWRRAR